jgi:hypothetical protein
VSAVEAPSSVPLQVYWVLAALENARVLPYPRSHEHLPDPYAKVTSSGRCSTAGQGQEQRWGVGLRQDEEMGEAEYESLPTDNLWQHLLAGGMAGMMEHCFMYPVDCVKTRMMVLQPNPEAKYRSLFEAFSKIIRTEHPRALFRGIGLVAGGAGPAHALYFSCYEVTKKYLTKANTRSTVLAQGVCDLCALWYACVCVCRTRLLFIIA